MKYFWYLPRKSSFFLIFSVKGKTKLFPSHFSLIWFGSAHLVCMILTKSSKCHFNECIKKNFGLRKPLEAAVRLTSHAN